MKKNDIVNIYIDPITATELELKAQVASLTAAHAMQGESLVTIPASMVIGLENKLKSQADEIASLRQLCYEHNLDWQAYIKAGQQ
jgi:hypothetical protein